jgi:hypothetical protein
VRHGQRAERLCRHRPRVGEYGEFTSAARNDLSGDAHEVTQIDEALPILQPLGAHPVEREHRLKLGAVAFPQRREAELAAVADEDDPTGNRHRVAGGRVGGQLGVPLPDLREGGGARIAQRVRLHPVGEHPVPLGPAHPHLLGKVLSGVSGRSRVSHGTAF